VNLQNDLEWGWIAMVGTIINAIAGSSSHPLSFVAG
jgi:hypothetical protein